MMENDPAAIAAQGRHRRPALGPAVRIAPVALLAMTIFSPGYFLFHHHNETAQQKFMEALERGNGPEANQIWFKMNEQERADWSHSIGIKPNVSKEDIQAELLRHARQQADKEGSDTPNPSLGLSQVEQGDIDSQTIEMPGLEADPSAGGLRSLPDLPGASGAAPAEPMVIP